VIEIKHQSMVDFQDAYDEYLAIHQDRLQGRLIAFYCVLIAVKRNTWNGYWNRLLARSFQ